MSEAELEYEVVEGELQGDNAKRKSKTIDRNKKP